MKRRGKVAGRVTYLPFLSDDLSHCDLLNWVEARPSRGLTSKEVQPQASKTWHISAADFYRIPHLMLSGLNVCPCNDLEKGSR